MPSGPCHAETRRYEIEDAADSIDSSSIRKRLIKSPSILQFPSLQNYPTIQTLHILSIRILSNHLRPQMFASPSIRIFRISHLPQILTPPTKSGPPLTNLANLSISHYAQKGHSESEPV